MGSGPTVWMAKPRAKSFFGIGLVELLGQRVRGRRLVHAHRLIEAAQHHVAGLRHQVAADGAAGVGEPVLESRAGGVQQQARRLNGVAGDDDRLRALEVRHCHRDRSSDTGDAAVFAQFDARDHAVVADLRALFERVGNMGDQRAGLGAHFAALDAEAAIDAVRAVAVRAGENGNRAADRHRDVERGAALDQRVADAAHRMRPVGIAVRMAPGIIRGPGDRHFQFELLIVGLNVFVGDGPVGADAIARVDLEVGRVKPRRERGPVHRAAAHALAAVVRAEGQRIGAAGDARIVPVELCEPASSLTQSRSVSQNGPASKPNHVEAGAGQALQQHAAGRAHADDHVIHFFVFAEPPHGHVDRSATGPSMCLPGRRSFKAPKMRLFQCVPPLP